MIPEENTEDDNKDLVWDLDTFSQRQLAIDFAMGFENKLCVYSATVGQLYTNYNIFFPQEENRKLVILPNPYAHHDTFHGIPEEAVSATGLHIIPGEKGGGVQLTIPFKSGKSRYRKVPLQIGIRLINQRRSESDPFLPVLMKGDLREMDKSTPCLHLHRVHLGKLTQHSNMELDGVRKVIAHLLASI